MTLPRNRTSKHGLDKMVLAGLDTLDLQQLPLAGTVFTLQTLAAFLGVHMQAAADVAATRAAWIAAIQRYRRIDRRVVAVLRALRELVLNHYGPSSPQLAKLGFTAPRRSTRTLEEKQLAAKRARATRKARRTMGARQKAAIHGDAAGLAAAAAEPLPNPSP